MPIKPKSHSERQHPVLARKARREYDQTKRRADPTLAYAKQIRSSARWQHVRALKISRDPLCEDPYGRHGMNTIAATEIDHITPLRVAPERAFDLTNTQSLCSACHATKSAAERQRLR